MVAVTVPPIPVEPPSVPSLGAERPGANSPIVGAAIDAFAPLRLSETVPPSPVSLVTTPSKLPPAKPAASALICEPADSVPPATVMVADPPVPLPPGPGPLPCWNPRALAERNTPPVVATDPPPFTVSATDPPVTVLPAAVPIAWRFSETLGTLSVPPAVTVSEALPAAPGVAGTSPTTCPNTARPLVTVTAAPVIVTSCAPPVAAPPSTERMLEASEMSVAV